MKRKRQHEEAEPQLVLGVGVQTPKWKKDGHVPSGWGHVKKPNVLDNIVHYAYEKMQFSDSPKPGSKK